MVTATEMEWHDRMVPTVFFTFALFLALRRGSLCEKGVTAREMEWHYRMVPLSFFFNFLFLLEMRATAGF